MSIHLVGSNIQDEIEASLTGCEEGDIIWADPGVDFCSTRMFRCVKPSQAFISGSPFSSVFSVSKSPNLGLGMYALPIIPGLAYYIEDISEFGYLDEYTIEHAKDPDRKRYFEAWITYYPTTSYASTVHYKESGIYESSDRISIKPTIYPDIHQSFTLNSTYYLTSGYYGFEEGSYGNIVGIWSSLSGAHVFTWNETTEQYDKVIDFVGTVRGCAVGYIGASLYGYEPVYTASILYYNDVDTHYIKHFIKIPGQAWAETGTYEFPLSTSWANLRIKFDNLSSYDGLPGHILVGGDYSPGKSYVYSTLALEFDSSTTEPYQGFMPASYRPYNSGSYVVSFDNGWTSILGGPVKESVIKLTFEAYRADAYKFSLPTDEDGNVHLTGNMLLKHIAVPVVKTTSGYLYDLGYFPISVPYPDSGYVFNNYLVNFSSKVYEVFADDELIEIETFSFGTHKKYSGAFFPAKWPFYFNTEGTTLRILDPSDLHYTDKSPSIVVLEYNSTAEITITTNFICTDELGGSTNIPINTSVKFLISADDITYYKWSGSAWVVESNISNGNDLATFSAGCQSGFIFPAEKLTAYVKAILSTTDSTVTPILFKNFTKLSLTTISIQNNAYLADDSKLKVEYISDTETKITSLMSQNVIMSYQLCIQAPPYNINYET